MSQNHKILTGEALFAALAKIPADVVKWVRGGMPTTQIGPSMALAIARGGVYEGKVSGGKLRLIREVDRRPQLVWQPCWRTTEAAVFPPSADYCHRVQS